MFSVIFHKILGTLVCPEPLPAMGTPTLDNLSVFAGPQPITENSTCGQWASWAPLRTDPAVVMQMVSANFVDMERNFLWLMELNSAFTRHHIYLMCIDDVAVSIFASLGIRCVPLSALRFNSSADLWKTRIRALSCLVMEGYDVIMSDADALWLGDPMEYFTLPGVRNSSVVASRGGFPLYLSKKWGVTMCSGFILFRATGPAMDTLQRSMEAIVRRIGDDQMATNNAVDRLGIAWDYESDMRYATSTALGRGTIETLHGDDGPFVITLLPHSAFTRKCNRTPISNETVVAHCYTQRKVGNKVSWMQKEHLWLTNSSSSWP